MPLEQCSKPLLVDDQFGEDATCYPSYIGDYNHPRTGNPVLNQPVFHVMIEGFRTLLTCWDRGTSGQLPRRRALRSAPWSRRLCGDIGPGFRCWWRKAPSGGVGRYMGVSIVIGVPKNGWFVRENPIQKWMTRGTPILGDNHMTWIDMMVTKW